MNRTNDPRFEETLQDILVPEDNGTAGKSGTAGRPAKKTEKAPEPSTPPHRVPRYVETLVRIAAALVALALLLWFGLRMAAW
ncbi:MAG: hypothetical protein GF418_02420 [Chitinivibrionales bacterium]|nr:hypothetical protein [Chitinivibrionales bacterium]MBD3394456.1 hypothetical protein [Chitinivibrionales bacterium]